MKWIASNEMPLPYPFLSKCVLECMMAVRYLKHTSKFLTFKLPCFFCTRKHTYENYIPFLVIGHPLNPT